MKQIDEVFLMKYFDHRKFELNINKLSIPEINT